MCTACVVYELACISQESFDQLTETKATLQHIQMQLQLTVSKSEEAQQHMQEAWQVRADKVHRMSFCLHLSLVHLVICLESLEVTDLDLDWSCAYSYSQKSSHGWSTSCVMMCGHCAAGNSGTAPGTGTSSAAADQKLL